MKTAFKWLDYFLNLLLFSTAISEGIFIYSFINSSGWTPSVAFKDFLIILLLLVSFIFGLLYIVLGIIFVIICKVNNKENGFAKKMLIKGIIRCIVAFILYFIFGLALSYFGLTEHLGQVLQTRS